MIIKGPDDRQRQLLITKILKKKKTGDIFSATPRQFPQYMFDVMQKFSISKKIFNTYLRYIHCRVQWKQLYDPGQKG